MANDEHLALLLGQGWNEWRDRRPDINPDLRRADLNQANLIEANLSHANLAGAGLFRAYLIGANLIAANLTGAKLSRADLTGADLTNADLSGADLTDADLQQAILTGATFHEAKLNAAVFCETLLANVDLSAAGGLADCRHLGPSMIDFQTLTWSKNLPLSFLRGCGLPDNLIDYLPSLREEAFQFYSCFISYSTKDQMFAERLHADLQNKGVRCWFAPHDLTIGAKTWDAIDEAIRLRDKLLLILSEASIASGWVEDEVSKAFAEERERNKTILFPIRIDDTVLNTTEPWARKLRDQRNIGDFRQWRRPAEYQKRLERLLRDLKASGAK